MLNVVETIDKSKDEACCQGCNQKLKVLKVGDDKRPEVLFGSLAAIIVDALKKDFNDVDENVDDCES